MKNETIKRLLTKEEVIMAKELRKEIAELEKRISTNSEKSQELARIYNQTKVEKGVESEDAKAAYEFLTKACNHGRFLNGYKVGVEFAFSTIREKTTFEGFKKSLKFWEDQIECDKLNSSIF
tara:strand:- start:201 stop:566 length:366 start_codon:yes stop_codon:yes gene_type:complete